MAEEIKENIKAFLKLKAPEKFSVRKLRAEMEVQGKKYSYHTILKWVMVLSAEPETPIKIMDYGNIKLCWYQDA